VREAQHTLDLGLDVVDSVRALDLESDGLAGEGLYEDLHGCGCGVLVWWMWWCATCACAGSSSGERSLEVVGMSGEKKCWQEEAGEAYISCRNQGRWGDCGCGCLARDKLARATRNIQATSTAPHHSFAVCEASRHYSH
jgi:hypothetical protein